MAQPVSPGVSPDGSDFCIFSHLLMPRLQYWIAALVVPVTPRNWSSFQRRRLGGGSVVSIGALSILQTIMMREP